MITAAEDIEVRNVAKQVKALSPEQLFWLVSMLSDDYIVGRRCCTMRAMKTAFYNSYNDIEEAGFDSLFSADNV